MKIEVDQSGKIEQTSLDTILALSNDIHYTLVLRKRTKRILQTVFRSQNKQRMFIYITFAVLVAILLKETKPRTKVVIDTEYIGHEDLLKKQIIEYAILLDVAVIPILEFGFIGKASPAHTLAEKVAYKKRKTDKIVSLAEIVKIIWPIKNDRVSTD